MSAEPNEPVQFRCHTRMGKPVVLPGSKLERVLISDALLGMAEVPEGCEINQFSSRCCERGTKSCIVEHA